MKIADLLTALVDAEIDFVVVGGFAMQMHGFQRATYDVDVALAMNEQNLDRFVSFASHHKLTPVIPEPLASLKDASKLDRWFNEKSMVAFALRGPDDFVLDVLIRPVIDFATLRVNAVQGALHGRRFLFAGLDEMLEMKRVAARPKDQLDIIALNKIKRGDNPNE
jgi:hypothetical protein